MNKYVADGLVIVGGAAVAAFVPALLTGDPVVAAQLALTFAGLIVLPVTPWVLMVELSKLEQLALAITTGLSGLAILWFIIGVLKGPLTLPVFIGVPAVVFAVGYWQLLKRKKHAGSEELGNVF